MLTNNDILKHNFLNMIASIVNYPTFTYNKNNQIITSNCKNSDYIYNEQESQQNINLHSETKTLQDNLTQLETDPNRE